MAKIRILSVTGEVEQERDVPSGMPFADTAMEIWPDGFLGYTPIIFGPDNEPVTDEKAVETLIQSADIWTIQLIPQGPLLALAPLSSWILLGVSLAASFLLAPKIPNVQGGGGGSYEWEDSDRPQFYSGQSNRIQPGRRVPDVFGRIRVYPDLISTPAIEYKGNNQTIRELYVVSRGEVTISRPRFHDESYDDVPETSIEVYTPGQKWPKNFPIIRTNAAVGTVELPASNEVINFGFTYQIKSNYIYVEQNGYWDEFRDTVGANFMMGGVNVKNRRPRKISSVSSNGRYLYVNPAFEVNQNISGGAVSFISLNYVSTNNAGNPRTYNISWKGVYSGTFTSGEDPVGESLEYYASTVNAVSPYPYQGTLIDVDGWNDIDTVIVNAAQDDFRNDSRYPGTGHPATAGFKWTKNINASKPTGSYYYVQKENSDVIYDPGIPGSGYATATFNVPGTSDQAWLDFEFPTGLYQQKSGEPPQTRTVRVRAYYRKQTSSGGFSYKDFSFTDQSRNPRRFTRKLTFNTPDEWEIYIERRTAFVPETESKVVQDSIRWIGLHGRQDTPDLDDDRLNCTLVDVTLRAQSLAVAGQDRKFNVIAQRILYNYQASKDQATRKISDAIFHTLYNMGNVSRTDVDEQALLDIQRDLEVQNINDSFFDAIIDQTMTVEDQASLIASAGRIMIYRRAKGFYFARLKANIPPVTLINGRNKIEPEARLFSFSETNDPDAIVLRYLNANKDWNEVSYQYPENVTAKNAEEQTVLGITNPGSIARMARYLWNKKKYERDTIRVKMMEEGILLSPGDVIAVTDYLSEAPPIEGEVIAVVGTSLTFDAVIPAGTYMLTLRDKYGSTFKRQQVTVTTAGSTLNIAAASGISLPSGGVFTTGLLYSFTTVQNASKNLFYVTRVQPQREGPVQIEGILYRNEVYAGDGVTSFSLTSKANRFQYTSAGESPGQIIQTSPQVTLKGL